MRYVRAVADTKRVGLRRSSSAPEKMSKFTGPTKYHKAVAATKKQIILQAMDQTKGNYTEAAKLLGVHPNYLHRLIRNLDLRDHLKN
jgi:DNA-binding NtrC family response regulator